MRKLDTSNIPETCPLIDEVIDFIDACETDTTQEERQQIIDTLEKIRSYNYGLRLHGESLNEQIREKEEAINDLERDLSKFECELRDVCYSKDEEIKELNLYIGDLEAEIKELLKKVGDI